MSTFNIQNQSGGVVNNVGRDQQVTGGQHGAVAADPADYVRQLRQGLGAAELSADVRASAHSQLDELERSVAGAKPDKQRAAGSLEKLTRVLVSAGPLASAAAALIGPIKALAVWIGPAAAAIPQLLTLL